MEKFLALFSYNCDLFLLPDGTVGQAQAGLGGEWREGYHHLEEGAVELYTALEARMDWEHEVDPPEWVLAEEDRRKAIYHFLRHEGVDLSFEEKDSFVDVDYLVSQWDGGQVFYGPADDEGWRKAIIPPAFVTKYRDWDEFEFRQSPVAHFVGRSRDVSPNSIVIPGLQARRS